VRAAVTCEVDSASTPGKCKTCGATIGTDTYCSVCTGTNYAPVNGACMDVSASNQFCTGHASGVCNQCGDASFMFTGGCYGVGGAPGSNLCTDASEGKCTQAAEGYFVPPGATADKQSVVKCDDTTGVTVGSNNGAYKGIVNCVTCTAPQTNIAGGTATCTACVDGKYGDTCATDCDANCKACKGTATQCTSCKDSGNNQYFKEGTNGDGTGTCVAEGGCGNTHFPVAADKKCYPCSNTDKGGIANCQTCSKPDTTVTCSACTGTNKPNTARTACVTCTIANCASCNEENVCEVCDSINKLTPTSQCVDKCDKLGGYYADSSNACKPCISECATCSGPAASDCTSCPPGRRLQYGSGNTKGSCVQQCVKDDSCLECGLTIGGTNYCSRCARSTEYPKNGVCTPASSRAAASSCRNVANGVCAVCSDSSFKLGGGCYSSKLLPGKAVCSSEEDGRCKDVVDGYDITYNGTLRTCPANCKTCIGGGCNSCSSGFYLDKGKCSACPKGCGTCPHGETCFDCVPGYYFSRTTCTACHEAIPKCSLCMVPADSLQPVCLEYSSVLESSALSAGAISGISISVILIVGGLVAVLVWLLVFRRKS
ncbi:Variant-specific surface protein, partial [Giardia duodenalis]